MLLLGGFQQGETILDPFCGSGTIPIEAELSGLQATGGDTQSESLEYAEKNADEADAAIFWMQSDATRLPLADQCVDGVVSNLPWGRQITPSESLEMLYRQTACELQRVTKADGKIVLLMPADYLAYLSIDSLGWQLISQTEISLFGQTPSIFVFQNIEPNANNQQEAGLIT